MRSRFDVRSWMFDVAVLLVLVVAAPRGLSQNAQPPAEPTAKGAATQPVDQAQLEKEFAERMTNVVMNGQYTVGNKPPKADKYTIVSVQKLKGDDWLFRAQVHFYEKAFVMPMIVPVKWAGDTAVISVTDFGLPGFGTYTARVLVYKDQYAGTWGSSRVGGPGGHMWGKIEKVKAEGGEGAKPAGAGSAPKQP
jgi:hypothetical protein